MTFLSRGFLFPTKVFSAKKDNYIQKNNNQKSSCRYF